MSAGSIRVATSKEYAYASRPPDPPPRAQDQEYGLFLTVFIPAVAVMVIFCGGLTLAAIRTPWLERHFAKEELQRYNHPSRLQKRKYDVTAVSLMRRLALGKSKLQVAQTQEDGVDATKDLGLKGIRASTPGELQNAAFKALTDGLPGQTDLEAAPSDTGSPDSSRPNSAGPKRPNSAGPKPPPMPHHSNPLPPSQVPPALPKGPPPIKRDPETGQLIITDEDDWKPPFPPTPVASRYLKNHHVRMGIMKLPPLKDKADEDSREEEPPPRRQSTGRASSSVASESTY